MNRIFKVFWNVVMGIFIVISEMVKSCGKKSGCRKLVVFVFVGFSSIMVFVDVLVNVGNDIGSGVIVLGIMGSGWIVIGIDVIVNIYINVDGVSVVMGYYVFVMGKWSIVIGLYS